MTEIMKQMIIDENNAYAGIGSRITPEPVLRLMTTLATALEAKNFTLRSGGAPGADSAFENGCQVKQIFVPWNNFQGKPMVYPIPNEAFNIAADFHPVYGELSSAAQCLMARNVLQILGPKLDTPSKFVICWTPDGVENGLMTTRATGGTGQAIRIATAFQIPVINIKVTPNIHDIIDRIGKTLIE